MKLDEIWSEYRSKLRAFLLKNIADPNDVDDLLQEVLIKTHHNLHTIENSNKLKPWLFQIARNTMIDYYRSRKTALAFDHQLHWTPESEADLIDQLSDCVQPFIEQLPEPEATLLKEIELKGVSQKEYAQQNNLKYSTLKSRVQKSRQQLHTLFTNCCEFSLDSRGNLLEITSKKGPCNRC